MLHEQLDVNNRTGSAMRNLSEASAWNSLHGSGSQLFSLVTPDVYFKSSTGGSQLTRYQQPVALPCRMTLALDTEQVVTIPD